MKNCGILSQSELVRQCKYYLLIKNVYTFNLTIAQTSCDKSSKASCALVMSAELALVMLSSQELNWMTLFLHYIPVSSDMLHSMTQELKCISMPRSVLPINTRTEWKAVIVYTETQVTFHIWNSCHLVTEPNYLTKMNEAINNTLMFVRLKPGAGYLSLAQTLEPWET